MSTLDIVSPTEYQSILAEKLAAHFGKNIVEMEWRTFPCDFSHYAPRIDAAVGPFAYGDIQYHQEYDAMADRLQTFIDALREQGDLNHRAIDPDYEPPVGTLGYFNSNARCFMTIEIEHRVTRKHLMGGAINAAALGRIAVVVGWTSEKVRALVKLVKYFNFLESVNKSSFPVTNIVVLSPEQLMMLVEAHLVGKSDSDISMRISGRAY